MPLTGRAVKDRSKSIFNKACQNATCNHATYVSSHYYKYTYEVSGKQVEASGARVETDQWEKNREREVGGDR